MDERKSGLNTAAVSVIVPVYNVEQYLEECLSSLQDQELEDIEVILVDDGSTDGSASIAKKFEAGDERFVYIRKENAGAGAARNLGVASAHGRYISFLDGDDILPPYALRILFEAAEEHGADVATGKIMRLKDGKYGTARLFEIIYGAYRHKTDIRSNKKLLYDTVSTGKLINREYWTGNGIRFPEDLSYCEDLPAAFSVYFKTDNVVMVDDTVYLWRIRSEGSPSATQKKSVDMVRDRIRALDMIGCEMKEGGADAAFLKAFRLKTLLMDLNILTNKAAELDDESCREALRLINAYIRKEGLAPDFRRLPFIYGLKYRAVMRGNIAKLRKLRDFQNDPERGIETRLINDFGKRKNRVAGIFPSDIYPLRIASLRADIRNELLRQNIQKCVKEKSGLVIEGCAFVRYLPVPSTEDVSMRAWLVDDRRKKVKKLKLVQCSTEKPAEMEAQKNANIVDYSGCGFEITVRKKDVADLPAGRYRILLRWESRGYRRETVIARIRPGHAKKLKGKTFPGIKDITLDATYNREPVILVPQERETDGNSSQDKTS